MLTSGAAKQALSIYYSKHHYKQHTYMQGIVMEFPEISQTSVKLLNKLKIYPNN